MSTGQRYILISPAKDEEKYIRRTLDSVLRQTVLPFKWVIVDDGSQDRTASIVQEYTTNNSWIILIKTSQPTERAPASGVVRAFERGYEAVRDFDFDFIVKLDCDLEFAPSYFEDMLQRFDADKRLGIASGVYLEGTRRGWVPVKMPGYHAAGAAKMIRKNCFVDIGGFAPRYNGERKVPDELLHLIPGWDTVDEVRAHCRGWRTAHFVDIQFLHLKPEGSAVGYLRTSRDSGTGHYLMGGGKLFFAFKFLQRLFRGRPPLLGAMAMLYGYANAYITRQQLIVSPEEAQSYRQLLNARILGQFGRILPSNMLGRKSR